MHLCLVRQHDGLPRRSHVDRQLGADPFPQQVAGGHHLDHGLPGRNISRLSIFMPLNACEYTLIMVSQVEIYIKIIIYHACKCISIYLDHGLPGKNISRYISYIRLMNINVYFDIVSQATSIVGIIVHALGTTFPAFYASLVLFCFWSFGPTGTRLVVVWFPHALS